MCFSWQTSLFKFVADWLSSAAAVCPVIMSSSASSSKRFTCQSITLSVKQSYSPKPQLITEFAIVRQKSAKNMDIRIFSFLLGENQIIGTQPNISHIFNFLR